MDVHTRLAENECKVCNCRTDRCCKVCKSVFYCSEGHRQEHWEEHTEQCLEIEAAKANLEDAEKSFNHRKNCPEYRDLKVILASIKDGKAPCFEFECFCTASCYRIMLARFNLIKAYAKVKTHRGAVNACNEAIVTQYLGRCDPMKIRCITANLMLRVGSQQDAYDFIRFWLVNGDQYACSAKDPPPFLNIRKANAFEPCRNLFRAFDDIGMDPPTSFVLPLALIKFKLLTNVKELRNLQILRAELPFDIVYMIKPHLHNFDIMDNNNKIRRIDTLAGYDKVIKKLEDDLDLLYEIAGRAFEGNYAVWRCFFEKDPEELARGYSEQAQKVYSYSCDAWMETPGGYQWILKKMSNILNRILAGENRVQAATRVAALYNLLCPTPDLIEPPFTAHAEDRKDKKKKRRRRCKEKDANGERGRGDVEADLDTFVVNTAEETNAEAYSSYYDLAYEEYQDYDSDDALESLTESFNFDFFFAP
ncbi:uncharacterized protein DFL_004693 [Arthrobotrys flagrans]|uniref:MYND-type domain-containing protein n=1 Tax=Arthrobotrys flagrans TaxID=97331 RepID=A0A437A5I0_ARTFL|nr:hypothetical protein DFL_004693 [Arthrobotrys flagrans]